MKTKYRYVYALGLCFGWSLPSQAATWYAAASSCSTNSGSCGTTLATACCTIQHAINRASDNDTVLVSPGTYIQTIDFWGPNPLNPTQTLVKGITVKKNITIIPAGPAILQRTSNSHPLVEFQCTTSVPCGTNHGTLGGVTTGGIWEGFTLTSAQGEAIKSHTASPLITGNIIENCGDSGIRVTKGAPTIRKNIIRKNNATVLNGGGGGGINLDTSSAIIEDNTICQNISTVGDGGGISAYATIADPYNLTITRCKIEANTAFGPPDNVGGGGGIRLNGSGTVNISRCIIRDNQAAQQGGGIFTKNVGFSAASGTTLTVNVKDSLIINNSTIVQDSGDGGGITFGDSANSSVINCTISNNYARQFGGGIYYFGSGTHSVTSSILWNDRSGTSNNPSEIKDDSAPGISVTYSDVQGGWTGTGSNNINSDPKFCNAVSNDYHLTASPMVSPCIDTGNTSLASSFDLDGNDRTRDGPDPDSVHQVDMGSYEYQGTGTGCTIGGVALSCPTSTCKAALIDSANPLNGTQDARQPHPKGTGAVPFSSRTGIGSPNTNIGTGGPEPITITLKNGGTLVSGATAPTCWKLCETNIELVESPTPALVDNRIVSIQETGTGVYSILLERPISGGNWTTVSYLGGSSKVSYASLPGDTDYTGQTLPADITWHVDCCLNCICAGGCSTDKYRCDIDHSGVILAADLTVLIDMLNGTGNFIVWNGKSLPTNSCLGGGFAGFAGGESGDPEDNGYFADWFVDYLALADPADAEEQFEFQLIVDILTDWVLDHFAPLEMAALEDALTDPTLKFVSKAGADAAAAVVEEITP